MSQVSKKTVVLACLACLAVGYLVSTVPGFDPVNPFVPKKPDRPIARLLAKLARFGLWVMVFAEPTPQSQFRAVEPKSNEEGLYVCHAEGW